MADEDKAEISKVEGPVVGVTPAPLDPSSESSTQRVDDSGGRSREHLLLLNLPPTFLRAPGLALRWIGLPS